MLGAAVFRGKGKGIHVDNSGKSESCGVRVDFPAGGVVWVHRRAGRGPGVRFLCLADAAAAVSFYFWPFFPPFSAGRHNYDRFEDLGRGY